MNVAEAIQEIGSLGLSSEVISFAITVKAEKRSTKLVYSARASAKANGAKS